MMDMLTLLIFTDCSKLNHLYFAVSKVDVLMHLLFVVADVPV